MAHPVLEWWSSVLSKNTESTKNISPLLNTVKYLEVTILASSWPIFTVSKHLVFRMNTYILWMNISLFQTSEEGWPVLWLILGKKKENDNIIWHFLFFKQAFWTVFQIPKVLQSFFILQPDFFVWPLRWGLEILMPVWSWWHIWCQESQPAWGTAQLPKCTTVPTCSHKVLLLVQEDLQHFNAVW